MITVTKLHNWMRVDISVEVEPETCELAIVRPSLSQGVVLSVAPRPSVCPSVRHAHAFNFIEAGKQ